MSASLEISASPLAPDLRSHKVAYEFKLHTQMVTRNSRNTFITQKLVQSCFFTSRKMSSPSHNIQLGSSSAHGTTYLNPLCNQFRGFLYQAYLQIQQYLMDRCVFIQFFFFFCLKSIFKKDRRQHEDPIYLDSVTRPAQIHVGLASYQI